MVSQTISFWPKPKLFPQLLKSSKAWKDKGQHFGLCFSSFLVCSYGCGCEPTDWGYNLLLKYMFLVRTNRPCNSKIEEEIAKVLQEEKYWKDQQNLKTWTGLFTQLWININGILGTDLALKKNCEIDCTRSDILNWIPRLNTKNLQTNLILIHLPDFKSFHKTILSSNI